MAPIEPLSRQLEIWALAHYGTGATISKVGSLGGHSGVTIGFDLHTPGKLSERLVLKIPPPGVKPKNNFDILRQVPLLQTMAAHDIPVPLPKMWSDDGSWFGSHYLVMSRVSGVSFPDIFLPGAGPGGRDSGKIFYHAIDVLVRIHAIDGINELKGWSTPRLLPQEIDHWVKVLQKSTDTDWVGKGMRVNALLHETMPQSCVVGIVHGDYYSNNWLHDQGRLTGVVDWESTTLGPILLDLGMLCMMYDETSWGPMRRANMGWHPRSEELAAAYAQRSALDLTALNWYRALAGYRLACNTAYYYELHRSGKRPNPAWDVLGESFTFMLDRALVLLNN